MGIFIMKEIKITKNQVTLVDDEDFEYLNQFKWCAKFKKESNTYYVERCQYMGGGRKNTRVKTLSIHRMIMKCPDGMIIDHIDGNPLNNQKENLRICNRSQNNANRRSTKNKASIYLGVGICKNNNTNKWVARIRKNNVPIWLGSFNTETQAAIAYNEAAIKLHGEFARLNNIKS